MHPNPFTLSLSSGIQVNPSENGYTLGLTASTGEGLIAAGLTVPALPGVENAIAHLREGTATLQQLTQTLSAREGAAVGEQLAATLQALGDRGWLQYGVLPLDGGFHFSVAFQALGQAVPAAGFAGLKHRA